MGFGEGEGSSNIHPLVIEPIIEAHYIEVKLFEILGGPLGEFRIQEGLELLGLLLEFFDSEVDVVHPRMARNPATRILPGVALPEFDGLLHWDLDPEGFQGLDQFKTTTHSGEPRRLGEASRAERGWVRHRHLDATLETIKGSRVYHKLPAG